MINMTGVYVLENKINNKRYVGQSINIEIRMRAHQSNSKAAVIDRAIKKYGWDNFEQFIFPLPMGMLNYFEIEIIKKLNTLVPNGYNVLPGGHLSSGMKGKKCSFETKKKMGESQKGRHHSEETKKKMSEAQMGEKNHMFGIELLNENNPMYGKKHTEEAKKKMSESGKGRKLSKETKLKMSKAKKDMSEETKKKMGRASKGRKHTGETKKKISIANKNPSDKTRKKMSIAAKDRRHTEETKKKISFATKGEKNPMFGRTGNKSPWFGKYHTEKSKKKMSIARGLVD